MADARGRTARVLLGLVVACIGVVGVVTPAAAAPADCGGGELVAIQDEVDPATIVGVRISGVGPACDGQPVGVQFLGNDAGDPALPSSELARSYSDEDPCTGAARTDGVLQDGAVEVQLCEASAIAGYVDGRQLTQLRLLTTRDAPAGAPGPAPEPAPAVPGSDPGVDPAPAPPPGDDLPLTGGQVLRAALVGGLLVAAGSGLLRMVRARRRLVA